MYFLTIVLLMFVFPIASVLTEFIFFRSNAEVVFLIGKWFVFWAVGVRLFLAGMRQSLNPRFTAEEIFGIKADEPLIIVQELGFANLSIGLLGIITIFNGLWIMPSAIAGCLFYGLAGIRHLTKKERNPFERGAMLSDLFIFIVLIIYFFVAITD